MLECWHALRALTLKTVPASAKYKVTSLYIVYGPSDPNSVHKSSDNKDQTAHMCSLICAVTAHTCNTALFHDEGHIKINETQALIINSL